MVGARHRRRRAHRRAAHRHGHAARPDRRQRARGRASRSRCSPAAARPTSSSSPLALAREMLAGAGRDDVDPADRLADGSRDGRLAGDDPRPGRRPGRRRCPRRRETHVVAAPAVRRADPARRDGRRRGRLAARRRPGPQGGPGAGRRRRRAGTPGRATAVTEGQPLLTLHTDDEARFERALASLEGGYDVAADGTGFEPRPLVIDRVAH